MWQVNISREQPAPIDLTFKKVLRPAVPLKDDNKKEDKEDDKKDEKKVTPILPTVKINELKVTPVKVPKVSGNIKGAEVIDKLYSNIFLCAAARSGKTNVIRFLLNELASQHTKIVVFAGTINSDHVWGKIVQEWEERKNPIEEHTSIYNATEHNILAIMVDRLQREALALKNKKKDKKIKAERKMRFEYEKSMGLKNPERSKIIRVAKPVIQDEEDPADMDKDEDEKDPDKILTRKRIFVFDDLSGELRGKTITRLTKEHYHYKVMNIISSQVMNDIEPGARQQVKLWLLFKGLAEKRLEIIYLEAGFDDTEIPYKLFKYMYKMVTKERYQLFYVNREESDFRHNFDQKIDVNVIKQQHPELMIPDKKRDRENMKTYDDDPLYSDKAGYDGHINTDEQFHPRRYDEEEPTEEEIQKELEYMLRNYRLVKK